MKIDQKINTNPIKHKQSLIKCTYRIFNTLIQFFIYCSIISIVPYILFLANQNIFRLIAQMLLLLSDGIYHFDRFYNVPHLLRHLSLIKSIIPSPFLIILKQTYIFLIFFQFFVVNTMQHLLTGQDTHYKTGFHGKPLIIAWLPLVNFAVIFASIKWCKYTFYWHLILASGVIILTLLSTIHILVDDWLSPNEDFKIQKVHNIAGLAVTIWLGIQIVTGIAARLVQTLPFIRTNTCIIVKRIHYISSYLLMLVSKFNYLNIKFMKGKYLEFAQYFVLQLLFLAVYLWIKSSYWTLSEDIVDGQLTGASENETRNKLLQFLVRIKNRILNLKNEIIQKKFHLPQLSKQIPIIMSENQITIPNYVTFNDVVYDISKLKYLHPGGQSIINLVNKRQVNRFLYGYYKPQNDHTLKTHNHTKESLRLCGKPIAKIQRLSPVEGFDDLTKFKISLMKPIRQNSSVWVLYLQPILQRKFDGARLNFSGYQEESQLGQHLTLTICDKKGRKRCTRLYTTVWCMRANNLYLIEKLLPGYEFNFNFSSQKEAKFEDYGLTQSLIDSQTTESSIEIINETIPLMIKKYNQGKLTSRLIVDDFKGQIVLSKPMGQGMRYHELPHSGKVIFVCGGTGILPFCDFIDLLFKRVKLLESTKYEDLLKHQDPLVEKDLIRNREFVIYLAVECSQDLIPTTVYQLDYLCRSEKVKFEVLMKIKRDCDKVKDIFKQFKYQNSGFNSQIEKSLTEQLSKIYVCGPYRMNQNMSKIFQNHNLPKQKYLFM